MHGGYENYAPAKRYVALSGSIQSLAEVCVDVAHVCNNLSQDHGLDIVKEAC